MKKYLMNQKFQVLLLIVITTLNSLISMVFIYIIQKVVDALTNTNTTLLYQMIMLFFTFLIINYLLGYLSNLQDAKLSRNIHIELKKDLFQAMIFQKYSEFKKTTIGQKINIFENDIEMVEQYYFNNLYVIIQSFTLLIFSLSYLVILDLFLAIALVFSAILILIIPIFVSRNIDEASDNYSIKKGLFIAKLKDYFSGIDIVKAYKVEKQVNDNYVPILNSLEGKLFTLRKKIGLYNQTMITGNYVIIAICFSIGGIMTILGRISLGQLIAITQIMNFIIQPMGAVSSAFLEIKGSKKIRNRLTNIIVKNKPENNPFIQNDVGACFKEIELKSVNYSTDDNLFSLNNIDIKIKSNKKYAIVGSSGSGKTTLLKLLANQLDINSGERLINGKSYDAYEEYLINNISFVHQDPFIFNDTLLKNITLYKDYDVDLLDEAIRTSLLNELINKETTCLESYCLEGGANLSGGEKQRISLSRAILRNTPVLMFDEITSALDTESSKYIEQKLLKLENKTMVFITHKLEQDFLKSLDWIFYIDKGHLIEQGNFETLIKNKSYFYDLYNS
ncbi:ABC transporter ATP-binding protein [Gottfriedia sp. NPDC058432]|uniref:ABC transporter ATP-binding protein n=1 Tax=Gottfriedia sp. NPDC058432 TaxID=3346497 RepID=UPI003656F8D9